jgi:hypothetical protein
MTSQKALMQVRQNCCVLPDLNNYERSKSHTSLCDQFTSWPGRYQGLGMDLRESDGVHSTSSHQSSQIIEGAATIFLGLLSWFIIPDFPDRNKFLTPRQTAFVLKRIEDDRGDSIPDALTVKKVVKHLSDWTLWAYGQTLHTCRHHFDLTLAFRQA